MCVRAPVLVRERARRVFLPNGLDEDTPAGVKRERSELGRHSWPCVTAGPDRYKSLRNLRLGPV